METDVTTEPTRKAYHHGDLRQTLIAAAEDELSEKGLEGFSLRGCAKRAGVSHAAPAHHFKDADALLSALAAQGFGRLNAALRTRQATMAGATPLERMLAAGLGYIDFALGNAALFRLMFSSTRPDHEEATLMQAGGTAFGTLVALIRDVTGEEFGADPKATADVTAAWSIVHGLSELSLNGKLFFLDDLDADARDKMFASIIGRAMPYG